MIVKNGEPETGFFGDLNRKVYFCFTNLCHVTKI